MHSCRDHCFPSLEPCQLQPTGSGAGGGPLSPKTKQASEKNMSRRGGSTSREDRGVWNRGRGLGSLLGRSRVQTWDRSACWLKWVPPAAHVNPITTEAAADQGIGCQTGDDIFPCLSSVSENSKENERAEKYIIFWERSTWSGSLRAVLYLLFVLAGC